MIPAPKLDDRTYDEILHEAIRLIPRYCPEWTNHNPSDPGITVLELAAWMTELLLTRLNKVPEKNYIAFLNLLGIRLKPAQPARALLAFSLVEGADRQLLREGTQVATPQAADEDTIVFETTRDALLVKQRVDRCFSYHAETYADNSRFLDGARPEGFEVFGGADRVERFLYVADPRLATLQEGAILKLRIGQPEHGGRDLARMLEWEYWNGRRWRELPLAQIEVEQGEAAFAGSQVPEIAPATINVIEAVWLRGRLAEVPKNPDETLVDVVAAKIEVLGEGLSPDLAFANLDNNIFLALDLGKNVLPFGTEPKVDHCFYLASKELLKQPGAEVRVEVVLTDPSVRPPPNPSEELTLSWEYFDGKKWRPLGRTGSRGPRPGAGEEFGFNDETRAFTRSGVVTFRRPPDMQIAQVNTEVNYWIRARIESGDYGAAGTYTREGEKWVWRDDRPLRPPALRSILFKYQEEYRALKHVLSFNDFHFRDHTEEMKTEYTFTQVFDPVKEEGSALYLGWDGKLPNELVAIYFQLAEGERSERPGLERESRTNVEFLAEHYRTRDTLLESEQRVVWEYWAGESWCPLVVQDQTKNFTVSGFVDFVAPEDLAKSTRFTEERHWIRARLEMGGYVKAPRLGRILTSSVEALNVVTYRDEVLGSSDGTPLQTYTFSQSPLLEGELVEVREREMPPEDELELLGESAARPATEAEGGGVWVRWKSVESFYDAGPRSRVYVADYAKNRVQFGDGLRGMVPFEGRSNVVGRRYRTGGGFRGNVNAGTLSALTRSIAYIDKVENPWPAGGGADAETVEEAKGRAPHQIKSRDRAVTADDFEQLALRASTGIARARCLPSAAGDGRITLVLLPKADEAKMDLTRKLVPSPELLRLVKNYLDERRLVGTVLEVVRPRYLEISLRVVLLRRSVGTSDRLRREIEERLRRFLHPLIGGRDGKGWPFGRGVYKSDLVHLVEDVSGVEVVDSIAIYDEDQRVNVEALRLADDELVHLVSVQIVERVRDEIA